MWSIDSKSFYHLSQGCLGSLLTWWGLLSAEEVLRIIAIGLGILLTLVSIYNQVLSIIGHRRRNRELKRPKNPNNG